MGKNTESKNIFSWVVDPVSGSQTYQSDSGALIVKGVCDEYDLHYEICGTRCVRTINADSYAQAGAYATEIMNEPLIKSMSALLEMVEGEIRRGARVLRGADASYVSYAFDGFSEYTDGVIAALFGGAVESTGCRTVYPVRVFEFSVLDHLAAIESGESAHKGKALAAARKKAGLSAYELAGRCGCTPQHIYQFEGGKTRLSADLAKKIANEVGIPWSTLV